MSTYRHHHHWRWLTAIGLAIGVGGIIGFVNDQTATAPQITATSSAATSQPPTAPSGSADIGPVGTVFTVTSTLATTGDPVVYDVAVTQVNQHAKVSNQFEQPATPGNHYAAVRFTVHGRNGSASGDTLNDSTVIITDTSQVQASPWDPTDGGNFKSGAWQVNPGQTVSGWVVFELPPGQSIAHVKWQPNGGFDGTAAVWNVS